MKQLFFRLLSILIIVAVYDLPSAHSAHDAHHKSGQPDTSKSKHALATYIANEGVMITKTKGDRIIKIVFDPLFDQVFNIYQPVPKEMRAQIIAGHAPFDNIDAVLISHYHGDHFSPTDMVSFIRANPNTKLYAPEQAITAMLEIDGVSDLVDDLRITPITLAYGDTPLSLSIDGIDIEAVRIPHAGGISRRNIQNLVFRVTLGDDITVIHMGDADTSDENFLPYTDHWSAKRTNMAFPPYWFFLSEDGRNILKNRINADDAIGIHVPAALPEEQSKRAPEYRDINLFTKPGETRMIPHHNK